MDFPRLTPPAISVHDVNGDHHDSHPSTASSGRSTPGQNFASSAPMPIPSKDMSTFVPPPLPPPPRINDLENGRDTGWMHANSQGSMDACKLAPINPGSSLAAGQRNDPAFRGDQSPMVDQNGRQTGLPPPRSPETQIKIELPPPVEESSRNPATAPGM